MSARAAFLITLAALTGAGENAPASLPRPAFYLPLDGTTKAAIASGAPARRTEAHADPILTLVAAGERRFFPGRVGESYRVGDSPLAFAAAGNFRADEGSCGF
ncbi:MAG: hypothetical protein QHJ73_11605, partial [Armatimonadota bacterium]|nr:hypothetical protein [Armatimonadota bacterium]